MTSPSYNLPALLSRIENGESVKDLNAEELVQLAAEIRHYLVESLAVTGGHLAPNLGIVELCIAMHRVFSTPRDKILFDVSHQCYVHKILTGRAEAMRNIRQFGGISGFCKRSESEHDAYGAGHAGTALSAALGMAVARDLAGEDYHVAAVVGDGAFTCGTTLEALNNIAGHTKKFILILNDNEWSIDKNVGALARYFASLQETSAYTWLRDKSIKFIEGLAGKGMREQASKLITAARAVINPLSFFREMGLNYYGPIDGHDIPRLEKVMRIAARQNEPVVLHVITRKGKGYAPAMQNPTKFHGVGQYNVEDGTTKPARTITYSEVFGQTLTRLAADDPAVTAITAAMPGGTKLDIFRKQFPKRFFDVGIAEEHAALFACGLATQGLKPYVGVYSTFMQRAVDMIHHDAALQKLPVRFCMDRAGLSPDDGPTHHGLYDISMLRCIPGIIMMQPADEAEFVHMLATMNQLNDCPSAIRYPRGSGEGVALPENPQPLPIGKAAVVADGADVALFALGNMNALAAQVRATLQAAGVDCAHINARFIKPLDEACLCAYAAKCKLVVTLEDHTVVGGFGSAVQESLMRAGSATPVLPIGWPDAFVEHGTLELLRAKHGLTPEAVSSRILEKLNISV
ncbi:MAG: 1-deoxy-D-xylulose-5-phosphate synthase [Akkermansiaceae bacterium]|nr:1-deoxy-D-xylulose-5-phosphate synthase [Akkermansiaceae bacterium]